MSRKYFFFIAIIEGAIVAALELLGQRIISSYYGESLSVWSCVLGVTLLSLAIGYFAGAKLSNSDAEKAEKKISRNFLIAAVFFSFVPLSIYIFYPLYSKLPFFLGCIVLSLIIYAPALITLTSVIPPVIRLMTINSSGKMAGYIYALSTFSSIVIFILLGFFVIPNIGITVPFLFFTLIMIIGWYLIKRNNKGYIYLAIIFICSFTSVAIQNKKQKLSFSIPYTSEGILGQLRVIDYKHKGEPARYLLINNIPQTNILANAQSAGNSLFMYVHAISTLASVKNRSSDVLLCGLGGGSLCTEFSKLGFNIDAIEIDKRIPSLIKKYFYFDFEGKVFIDDCRHYLRLSEKKYDLIVFDLLNGEVQPAHLFTIEALGSLKKNLKENGAIIINFQSYAYGPKGNVTASIFKTLKAAGYAPKIIFTENEKQSSHDIIFWASLKELDFLEIKEERINPCCKTQAFLKNMTTADMSKVDTLNAYVYTDNRCSMELKHGKVITEYRKYMMKNIANMQFKEGSQFFK